MLEKDLKLGVSGGSREGNDVANVLHAGYIHENALEPETEAGVGTAPPSANVEVPGKGLPGNAHGVHPHFEDVMSLLPLAAADDFPYSWKQQIHGCYGAFVIIETHIKGLDLGGIVDDKDRTIKNLFSQVALMLRLQVEPPFHRKAKFAPDFWRRETASV